MWPDTPSINCILHKRPGGACVWEVAVNNIQHVTWCWALRDACAAAMRDSGQYCYCLLRNMADEFDTCIYYIPV